jgi:hypothetical protein
VVPKGLKMNFKKESIDAGSANHVILSGRVASEVRYGVDLERDCDKADFMLVNRFEYAPKKFSELTIPCRAFGLTALSIKRLPIDSQVIVFGKKRTSERVKPSVAYIDVDQVEIVDSRYHSAQMQGISESSDQSILPVTPEMSAQPAVADMFDWVMK